MYNTVMITGASSGIGKALAIKYSKISKNLLLIGRNEQRLLEVKNLCMSDGLNIETAIADVSNKSILENIILDWDSKYNIDLVYANAGISGGTSIHEINSREQFDDVMDTNVIGVFNTVNPLINKMIARKTGHIVLLSSMAGFVGMPSAVAYSVSKVTVKAYGDAIRPLLKANGIKVSTIFPGFIKTHMTEVNKFEMPFLIEADEAADIIIKKVEKGRAYIAFPLRMYLIVRFLSILPHYIRDFIFATFPKK